MFSPAQRHQQRILQQQKLAQLKQAMSEQTQETVLFDNNSEKNALLMTQFKHDLKDLSRTNSKSQENIALKNTLLKNYRGFLDEYEASDAVYANPILVYAVIWMFDCGHIVDAIKFGHLAVAQSQPMPEPFKRTIAAFFADEVFNWAVKEKDMQRSFEPYFSDTFKKIVHEKWQLHGDIYAKYYKFAAEIEYSNENYHLAHALYVKVQEHATKNLCIKTNFKRCQQAIEKDPTPPVAAESAFYCLVTHEKSTSQTAATLIQEEKPEEECGA